MILNEFFNLPQVFEKDMAEGSETYKQGHAKFRTKTNKQIGPTHYGRGSDKKADSYTKADPRYHEVRPVKEQGVAEAEGQQFKFDYTVFTHDEMQDFRERDQLDGNGEPLVDMDIDEIIISASSVSEAYKKLRQKFPGQAVFVHGSTLVEQGVAEGLSDTQKKIEDTVLKLEQRLKFAKTPEQWDNIKNRIERLQAGLNRSKQGVAEGLNEFAQGDFNGSDDSNDLQLYLNVAKKLNMKKYKPSTAHDLIAKKMAELVDAVDDEKVDWARHMARKAQGLPSMLDQQGVAEGSDEQEATQKILKAHNPETIKQWVSDAESQGWTVKSSRTFPSGQIKVIMVKKPGVAEGFSVNDLRDGPYKEGFIQGIKTNNQCNPPYPEQSNDSDLYKRGFYYGRMIKRDKEQDVAEGAPIATTPDSIDPGGATDNFKQQMANNTEIAYQKKLAGVAEAKDDYVPPQEANYDEKYQAMVRRVGEKAKQQEKARQQPPKAPVRESRLALLRQIIQS